MFPRVYLKETGKSRLQAGRTNAIVVALIALLLGALGSEGFQFNLNTEELSAFFEGNGGLSAFPLGELLLNLPQSLWIFLAFGIVAAAVFSLLFGLFISNVVAVGLRGWFLRFMRGENVRISELFAAFRIYRPAMVTKLLTDVYTFLWSLLFIIPGIIKWYSYSMTDYIIYENPNISADRAITMSRRMTDGYKGELFILDLSFLGWQLLSALTLGILGIVYVNPYMLATHAAAYDYLKAEALRTGKLTWADFGQLPPTCEAPFGYTAD